MTEQELKAQVEKIKKSIAQAFREVDEITFSDFGADSILRWEELTDEAKETYYRYAGELTDDEIYNTAALVMKKLGCKEGYC